MSRAMSGLLGIVMALFPEQVRGLYERFAFVNSEEVRARSTFSPAIRAEGIGFVLVSVLGGRAYRASMYALGLAGTIALVVPKQALRFSETYAYERPETIEWNEGVVGAIRCIGVLYLLISLSALTNRNQETTLPE